MRRRFRLAGLLFSATVVFSGCEGGTGPREGDGSGGTTGSTGVEAGSGGSTATGGAATTGEGVSTSGAGVPLDPDAWEPDASGATPGGDAGGSPDAGGDAAATPDAGGVDSGTVEDAGSEPSSDCTVRASGDVPVGYGQHATGGGNASPLVVSSFGEAEQALATYRDQFKNGAANALVLHYDGSFDFSTVTDVCAQHSKDAQVLYIKEMENVTFLGLSGSSANFGIKVNRAKNVIIRNMTMGLLPGGGSSDAITLEGNGTNGDVENVWIDHNDLFSSTKDDCPGAGDTEFDGLIDIKKGARYITISYNHLHDHQKTGLLGHSDSDDVDRYVTFHHNWYESVVSRTPLHRFGYVHIFNNYYNDISGSGINVRMGGVALIEANYFENVANPVTSRYSDDVGYWDLRDNYVGPGISWTTGSDTLANADDWQSTAAYPDAELTYSATLDPAQCVREIVKATAGATL